MLIGAGAAALGAAGATAFGLSRMGSMTDWTAAVAATRATLPDHPELRDLVRYATTLAASGHNTQPWRFHIEEGRIAILPDFSRRTPVVDPDDLHFFASSAVPPKTWPSPRRSVAERET